jgi:DNA-binding Lrp family transcriptional regulator
MSDEKKLTIRQIHKQTGLSPLAIRARLEHLQDKRKAPAA